jgi:hypothetical protein
MADLPKSVLRRLRQRAGGPTSAPGSTTPARPLTAEHPDANLLTAFAEKTLTAKERELVMEHLVECSQCREQLLLAFPPEAQAAQPGSTPIRAPAWLAWPSVRWGALAAALGSVLVVLILYHPEKPHEVAMSPSPPSPAAAGASEKTLAPPAKKSAEPIQPGLSALQRAEPSGSLTQGGAEAKQGYRKNKPSSISEGLTQAENPPASEASTPTGPAPAEAASLRSDRAAREVAPGVSVGGPIAARGGQAPTVPSPAPSPKAAQPAKAILARAEAGPAESSLDKQAQASAPSGATNPAEAESRPAAGLAPNALRTSNRLWKAGRVPQSISVAGQSEAAPGMQNVHWSISSSARIQRSLDGGQTWEELHIDDAVVFRVVTALEGDVWAGASKGAVYYSADGGAHWVRVTLSSSGPTDAIVGITFSDRRHGSITTAAGDQWATTDGGKHWTRP